MYDTLYVITALNNSRRYKRRWELYQKFAEHLKQFPNVVHYTIELVFADRDPVVTEDNNPRHIRLRSDSEVWVKENLINVCVSRLPSDWRYVAWIDADVRFLNKDWSYETVQMLQHHPIVQLFQTCGDMGPDGHIFKLHHSFAWEYQQGKPYRSKGYEFWHPGYAWAATRDAWNTMGGLPDWNILGSGDTMLSMAVVGMVEKGFCHEISPAFTKHAFAYQKKCEPLHKNMGYVNGTIVHSWHGQKKNRKYIERWRILVKHSFDPVEDIVRDYQGIINICEHKPYLKQDISKYFRERNEDSIDFE